MELPEQVRLYCAHHAPDLIREYEHEGNMCVYVMRADEVLDSGWIAIPKGLLQVLRVVDMDDANLQAQYQDILTRCQTDEVFKDLIESEMAAQGHTDPNADPDAAPHPTVEQMREMVIGKSVETVTDLIYQNEPFDSTDDLYTFLLTMVLRIMGPDRVKANVKLWEDGFHLGEETGQASAAVAPISQSIVQKLEDFGLKVGLEFKPVAEDPPTPEAE